MDESGNIYKIKVPDIYSGWGTIPIRFEAGRAGYTAFCPQCLHTVLLSDVGSDPFCYHMVMALSLIANGSDGTEEDE